MSKIYKYKCQFTGVNLSTGYLGHFTVYEVAISIKAVMKTLRLKVYRFGKDFIYWKLPL